MHARLVLDCLSVLQVRSPTLRKVHHRMDEQLNSTLCKGMTWSRERMPDWSQVPAPGFNAYRITLTHEDGSRYTAELVTDPMSWHVIGTLVKHANMFTSSIEAPSQRAEPVVDDVIRFLESIAATTSSERGAYMDSLRRDALTLVNRVVLTYPRNAAAGSLPSDCVNRIAKAAAEKIDQNLPLTITPDGGSCYYSASDATPFIEAAIQAALAETDSRAPKPIADQACYHGWFRSTCPWCKHVV